MKMKLAGISGIVAALLSVTSVQAVPISGNIYMGGEAVLNNSENSVTSWPYVYVLGDSSAFSSIAAFSTVTMSSSPWVFSPAPGAPLANLWTVGGFTFNFLGDTVSQSGNFLNIAGFGTISSDNSLYDTTDFTWNLSAENVSGTVDFIFSATTGASSGGGAGDVPDGGLTLALLGVALAGIEVFRRKVYKV